MRRTGSANILLRYYGKLKAGELVTLVPGLTLLHNIEVLIFTTFTLTLVYTTCYIAVEIYEWDMAKRLSRW